MPEPTWKKWLSYLAEIHIESASSEHNPHMYVSLRNGRYQLSTAHAIYSYGDLYTNFDRAFQKIDLNRLPGKEVLILGLGLGSIPIILEQTYERHYHYTAVEIDESVLDLAHRYTLGGLASPIELICTDAHAFMMQTEEKYDLICMDIFLDDEVPENFESPAFLEALRDSLNPGGVLLYNRLAAKTKDVERTRVFFENRFLPVFPQGAWLDVGGNWILINRPDILKKRSQ